ncbi:MAG: DUF6273 domain-containing protein [Acutalibacteraceae bacterium]|jgi:hypothetical protein
MKTFIKKNVALVLAIAMFTGLTFVYISSSLQIEAQAFWGRPKIEIIEFGSYPQSQVTDSETLSKLNKQDLSWQSYGYYSGDGTYNSAVQGDWMKYADVSMDGNQYRAVFFSQYRPRHTGDIPDITKSTQSQKGYFTNTVYWFKFEPVKWRVLDSNTGLLLCEKIIDSQPFSSTCFYDGKSDGYDGFFRDESYTAFANNYPESTIREWLNDDFYNLAFNEAEKSRMLRTVCENKCRKPEIDLDLRDVIFNCEDTEDYVFLLSQDEVCSKAYGFSTYYSDWDDARKTKGTDYAKSQGLSLAPISDNNSQWWLRTPGHGSDYVCEIDEVGHGAEYYCDITNRGVRPAIRVGNLKESISNSIDINYKDVIEFASVTNVAADKVVSYYSSDDEIASVDENGTVTATGRGTATVTCIAENEQGEEYPINIEVNVDFTVGQWLIWIFLLGFLWY